MRLNVHGAIGENPISGCKRSLPTHYRHDRFRPIADIGSDVTLRPGFGEDDMMSKWAVALAVPALLLGCASLPEWRQGDDPRAAAAEVKRLEEGWTTAFNNRDSRFMEQVMAPEYVLATSAGPQGATVTRREDWMRVWLGQDRLHYDAKVLDVVVVGDTAVATLEARWRRDSFLTDTWARRHGRWQLIFRHSAPRR